MDRPIAATLLRRDFLAVLLAVPTLGACGASSTKNQEEPDAAKPKAVGAGGGAPPSEAGVSPETGAPLDACTPTLKDLEGPYYEAGAPLRAAQIASDDEPGIRLLVEGHLLGPNCQPLPGYVLDIWHADKDGNYFGASADYRLRGKIVSNGDGRYRFETIVPGRYGDAAGIRPAHLHVKVWTPMGNELLTTQLYFAGDPHLGDADYCTRSGACNSNDPARILTLADAAVAGRAVKRASFDAVLART